MVEGCLAVSHQTIIDDGCNTEVTMRRLSLVVAIGALFVNCTTTTGGGATDLGPGTTDHGAPDPGQTVPDTWVPGEEAVANDVPSELGHNQMALYESGTRIRAKLWRTADGAQQWAGWYDDELKMACWMQPAGDGTTRCLPTILSSTMKYFEDAACSKPVFFVSACDSGAKWGKVYPATQVATCTTAICPLHEVGKKVTTGSFYTLNESDGKCTPIDLTSLFASYEVYSVGKQVEWSIFAEVTETIE